MATDFGTLILNETPDAVIVTTPGGTVVCWTRGAQVMFGYSAEEATGRLLSELILPQSDAHARAHDTLLESVSYEARLRGKDGATLFVDSSCKSVRDAEGQKDFVLWVKRDVTRLKAERDARLIETTVSGILELTEAPSIVSDTEGRIVLANSQAERLFGYGAGELRGRSFETLAPTRVRAEQAAQSELPHAAARRDMLGVRKNGEQFALEISISRIETEQGALIMSVLRDASERRSLERRLQDKTDELARARAVQERFLGAMSRELHTPLGAIIGFAGTLLTQLPGPINADQEHQLRIIEASGRQLLGLVEELLDLHALGAEQDGPCMEQLVCQDLIEELGARMRPLARRKGLQLVLDCPDQAVVLRTDGEALRQILANLLENALKYTSKGKVELALCRREAGGTASLAFSVSDTGSGISPDDQAAMFEPFASVADSARQGVGGAGLGLHLSQRLAATLNGKIICDSSYGVGSVFTLLLPLNEEEATK